MIGIPSCNYNGDTNTGGREIILSHYPFVQTKRKKKQKEKIVEL